jgi:cbb3-type cytochrome c oxidase subunit III
MRRSDSRRPRALHGAAFAAGAVLAASAALAADGKALFAPCVACHGPHGEGVPATGAPNIAGSEAWYVERQLKNFATGLRGAQPGDGYGAAMKAGSAALRSDGDRSAVAAYVAGLPRTRAAAAGTAVPDNGRNYFNAICSACHGSNGLGNEALGAPRLAGLPATYLARQLAAFKSGQRGAQNGDRLGAQMRSISAMLPDARTEQDVIAYAASLKP